MQARMLSGGWRIMIAVLKDHRLVKYVSLSKKPRKSSRISKRSTTRKKPSSKLSSDIRWNQKKSVSRSMSWRDATDYFKRAISLLGHSSQSVVTTGRVRTGQLDQRESYKICAKGKGGSDGKPRLRVSSGLKLVKSIMKSCQ